MTSSSPRPRHARPRVGRSRIAPRRLDAADDRNDAYLSAAETKNCIHKVVPRSFIAQLYFEPLIKKFYEAVARRRCLKIGPIWPKLLNVRVKGCSRYKIDCV